MFGRHYPKSLLLGLFLVLGLLVMDHLRREWPQGQPDVCLACHSQVKSPDSSHPVEVLGCSVCHLGNAYALDKDRAHTGMATNPGDLRCVEQTCGRTSKCHAEIVPRVKRSVMATNAGIVKTLYERWKLDRKEVPAAEDVPEFLLRSQRRGLAEDHFAKMCASCHLWKERQTEGGEMALRGGGCSACHVVQMQKAGDEDLESFEHARLSTRIPSANCLRCHNRSARQGLAYAGRFESAGYGTPYVQGRPGRRRLSGGRFYLELPPDVHQQAGMTCIDCHTHLELMGDGQKYDSLEEQLEISCSMCHDPQLKRAQPDDVLARRLVRLNRAVPELGKERIAYSEQGTPIYNLRQIGAKTVLFRKLDGRPLFLDRDSRDTAWHRFPGHERLSCQACHSRFMPQCYGCHLEYRQDEFQRDKLSGEQTRGRWHEGRSYLRFEDPLLGLDGERIRPFAPCQVMVSVFDESGSYRPERGFTILSLTAFDPHTTQTSSRSCLDCHAEPKALGLGEGQLSWSPEGLDFRPVYDARRSGFGASRPPSAFTTLQGEQLQVTAKQSQRPFSRAEIQNILSVTPCLGCHDDAADPVYEDFTESSRRLEQGQAWQCWMNQGYITR